MMQSYKLRRLAYCTPLVDAVLTGISNRFGAQLENTDCQLAAAFHPKFRLVRLDKYNQAHVPRVTKAMETAVEAGLQEHEMAQEANSTASSNDDEDDFFSGITRAENNGRIRSQRSALSGKFHSLELRRFLIDLDI